MTSSDNNMVMPVAPYYGGGAGDGGFGFGGGWWIILLLAVLGWGNGGFGGGYGNGGAFPWIMNGQNSGTADMQRGFDQAAVTGAIGGVRDAVTAGFGNVQTALCNGFAGVNQGVASGFAQAEVANNARQMANMQQAFANQTAMNSGFTAMQSQLAQCCCDNRLGTEGLKATVLQENCADRYEAANNTRDIITNASNNTQKIMDKLCQLEMDGLKQNYENRIATLQNALDASRADAQSLRFAASQSGQTAQILAGQAQRANEVEMYLNPPARPAYIVQNPNCCPQNYGCGCGCGGATM